MRTKIKNANENVREKWRLCYAYAIHALSLYCYYYFRFRASFVTARGVTISSRRHALMTKIMMVFQSVRAPGTRRINADFGFG